ncbi:UBX domain-containing protein 1 isoform X2 [Cimex lectularius]|nr:UBX domain-containing protein 1 isoform X2 [Cimex lectularius]
MEWLLAHGDELEDSSLPPAKENAQTVNTMDKVRDQSEPSQSSVPSTSSATEANEAANSLKCEECGKLFVTQLEVEVHATKTGHSKFCESTEQKKPLTEEEKKEQLRLVEMKIKEKKKEREEREKAEALEREKNRIKAGKEYVAIKKKLEDDELKKAIELRKREKEEDRMARQRIKEQIEADKAARRAKAAEAAGTPFVSPTVVSSPKPAVVSKDYTETKLQIRLTNGQSLTQSFGIKEQLSAVRLYIQMNRTDGEGPFLLMTTFPKKVFQDEDFDKPLDVLGLVPSAVITVSKVLN